MKPEQRWGDFSASSSHHSSRSRRWRDGKRAPAKLTGTQIVQKHVAARAAEGLAWSPVMRGRARWSCSADPGTQRAVREQRHGEERQGAHKPASRDQGRERKQAQVPFTLEMKRPAKSRIEIEFGGKTAVQVSTARALAAAPY